jgi:hypothetical protein
MTMRSVAMIVFCAGLAACGDAAEKLVGTWESHDGGYVNRLELRPDGTFKGNLRRDTEGLDGHYSGTWQVQRGHYFGIFVTESDFALLAPGYSFAQEVVEYDGDHFVLRATSNHDETWTRIATGR